MFISGEEGAGKYDLFTGSFNFEGLLGQILCMALSITAAAEKRKEGEGKESAFSCCRESHTGDWVQ